MGIFALNRSLVKQTVLILSVTALASCRLVITTDDTGRIASESGSYDCDQVSCAFPITEKVTETFTAIPAEGHRFVRWEKLCITSPTEICNATVAPLAEEHQQFDGDIGLSAVFESSSRKRRWFRDNDGDHYGASNESIVAAERPEGFVVSKTDCNDSDVEIHPWAKEVEDLQDNNCNGKIDEGFVDVRFYWDSDEDGYGDPEVSQLARRAPAGYVRNDLDCNDLNASDNPDGTEVVDGRDNDCDGRIDEGGTRYYRDVDGDGYGVSAGSIESIDPIDGYVENDDDCDDNNSLISPAAQEQLDGADNNCDGAIDEGFTQSEYYRDIDGDGYGDAANAVLDYTRPSGYAATSGDNCIGTANPSQGDVDNDGIGDACDAFTDSDADNVQDSEDNCSDTYNPSQSDTDGDGVGNACDLVDDSDDGGDGDGGGGNSIPCTVSTEEQEMLQAINAFRAETRVCGSNGTKPAVPALTWSCELETAAANHSLEMANNNYFSHTGLNGSSAGNRATLAGYVWSAWGENIAAGYFSVSAVMQGWIDSDGHCANMMHSAFTEVGAARASNSSSTYNTYWTQVFGRR